MPILGPTQSGATGLNRTYSVKVTFVDDLGNESSASDPALVFLPATKLLKTNAPVPGFKKSANGINYSQWNLYAGEPGSEYLQNVSPMSIAGTPTWTEPIGGLFTSGPLAPTVNAITPLEGYVIQFRYFKERQQVTTVNQVLQIPDNYRDVVIAGVNWLTEKFLRHYDDAKVWNEVYKAGIIEIIRDKNIFPKGDSFISPDSASLSRTLPSIESLDLTRFMLP